MLMLTVGVAYTQRHAYSDDAAELSRSLIGDENTARLEGWYFAAQDRADRWKYSILGGSTTPFEDEETLVLLAHAERSSAEAAAQAVIPDPLETATHYFIPYVPYVPPAPKPLELPATVALRTDLAAGEGVWTTEGLPRTSPEDVLMAKTFIRPDKARPYASVGVLLVDRRRALMHLVAGTEHPGGDRGVKGPGIIPVSDRSLLLAAWNGGFQGPHGGYGMIANGKTYRPLRTGFASVAVLADGTVQLGEWGKSIVWRDDMVAVRQNAVLLVDNCQVSPRTKEGNNTWGYVEVNSAEFITWRSGIGLTATGDLLVAAGNSLSAESLARAMWAAGACWAMQLDINSPYVLTSLFFAQPDGSAKAAKFVSGMSDNPARFFNTQSRDFMYLTLDETRFVP
jgi:Phosphodiester glycosidase